MQIGDLTLLHAVLCLLCVGALSSSSCQAKRARARTHTHTRAHAHTHRSTHTRTHAHKHTACVAGVIPDRRVLAMSPRKQRIALQFRGAAMQRTHGMIVGRVNFTARESTRRIPAVGVKLREEREAEDRELEREASALQTRLLKCYWYCVLPPARIIDSRCVSGPCPVQIIAIQLCLPKSRG